MIFINLFLFSFLVSVFITVPAAKMLALYLNIVDVPDGNLKKHQTITPYLGGFAIFVSLWTMVFLVLGFDCMVIRLFLGTMMILLIGLVDDLFILSPIQKLIGQIATAIFLVYSGFYIDLSCHLSLSLMISIFWIVAVINAFNLVDVMDGLATTIGSLATSSLIWYAFYFKQIDLVIILIILLGAQIAFLFYNRPRAKIYLGDAGSMLIGTILAAVILKLDWNSLPVIHSVFQNYLIGPIILGIPLTEVLSLVLIRKFKNISFYNGSPDHFKHYLKSKGWSDWAILCNIVVYAILIFSYSLVVAFSGLHYIVLLLLCGILLCSWLCVVFIKKDTIWPKK